jgi:hypothetical protein
MSEKFQLFNGGSITSKCIGESYTRTPPKFPLDKDDYIIRWNESCHDKVSTITFGDNGFKVLYFHKLGYAAPPVHVLYSNIQVVSDIAAKGDSQSFIVRCTTMETPNVIENLEIKLNYGDDEVRQNNNLVHKLMILAYKSALMEKDNILGICTQ